MQFDPDIARRIMLELEERPANAPRKPVQLPDIDQDTLYEHLDTLINGGLVDGMVVKDSSGKRRLGMVLPSHLTYAGHEFLSDAKNEQLWEKAKALVKDKGGAASFAVLTAVLKQLVKQHFGLSM